MTYSGTGGWELAFGKGNGGWDGGHAAPNAGMKSPHSNDFGGASERPVFIADLNGDRKDDIFDWNQAYSPTCFYSKGDGNFTTETPGGLTTASMGMTMEDYWPGDYNGDGAMDFLTRSTYFSIPYLVAPHPNETRHQVGKIQDGLGAATTISYTPLSNGNVYSAGNSYSYPYQSVPFPLKVVSSVNNDNGVNQSGNTTSYTYSGIKVHLLGRGMMGFDKVSAHDVVNNIDNITAFSLNTDFAFPYLSSQTVSQTVGGFWIGSYYFAPITSPLSSVNNTYSFYSYGNLRVFPYLAAATSTNYLENTTATETYNYTSPSGTYFLGQVFSTDIGKPASITTNKGNGLDVTTQTFTYPPSATFNPGNFSTSYYPLFYYSKPSAVTVSNTRQGQAAYARTMNYNYSMSNGLLTSSVSDPGTSNAVTTAYTYDAYGNTTQKTTSGSGVATVTENYVYDPTYRFVIKSYNAAFPSVLGQSAYDAVSGNVTNVIDPDGLITSYTYNGFGQVKTTAATDGSSTAFTIADASGNTNAPSGAKYMVQAQPNTAAASYKFYDRLGRQIRSAVPGMDGTMIYEDVSYGNNGQVATRSKPYFQTGSPQLIGYSYDGVGRQTAENRPEGTNSLSYSTSGGNYTVTAQTMDGLQKVTTCDASGKVKSVTDNGGTLSYTYHSNGQPLQISSSSAGVVAKLTYDNYGHKLTQVDPNFGGSTMFQFTYDAYGEKLSQKDPHGTTYSYAYNARGNMTSKTGPEGTYTYYYYNNGGGFDCGKLTLLTGPGGVTQTYAHSFGDRLTSSTLSNPSVTLQTQLTYDGTGRVATVKYPNGTTLAYTYNANDGSLVAKGVAGEVITNPPPFNFSRPAQLYSVLTRNAFGQVTAEGLQSGTNTGAPYPFSGFNIGTTQTYDMYGTLTEQSMQRIGTQTSPSSYINWYKYEFDPASGNLADRTDMKYGQVEYFTYDNLNRLTAAQGNPNQISPPPAHVETNFLSNGNISMKSDAGQFSYTSGNRVSAINAYVNIPNTTQNVTYTPFDKVKTIAEGPDSVAFTYWADGSRSAMMIYKSGVLKKTKYYAPDFEREVDGTTGVIRDLCYVSGSDGKLKAILVKNNGADSRYFVGTDHLGSITQIVDAGGNLVEEKSFDAWGRARNPQTWTPLAVTYASNGWDRGYTSHESIPQFGIINMNGRLYDPLLGRMFSPDDQVQASDNTQSFNRYSYCMNNPLKYTDPNGEFYIWDDVAVFGIGTLIGYVEYGAVTHDWGKKAIVNGLISGALAEAGYLTCGGTTVFHATGTVALNYAAEYGATYAVGSGMNFLQNASQIAGASQHGWDAVGLGAAYNAIAAVDAGFKFDGNHQTISTVINNLPDVGSSALNGGFDGFSNYFVSNGYDPDTRWSGMDMRFTGKAVFAGIIGAGGGLAMDYLTGDIQTKRHDISNWMTPNSCIRMDYIGSCSRWNYIGKHALNELGSNLFQNMETWLNCGTYSHKDFNFGTFSDVLSIGVNDGIFDMVKSGAL